MSKFVNLIGKIFGQILIVERDLSRNGTYWFYECNCAPGIILKTSVRGMDLTKKNNPQKSCGCLNREITRQKFEELRQKEIGKFYNDMEIIDARSDRNGHKARTIVTIKCFCGVIFESKLDYLNKKKNSIKSCGCIQNLLKLDISFNKFFSGYKSGAIKRGCFFVLEKEDFREIVIQNCNYCNCGPRLIQYNFDTPFFGNGADQIIAQGGYTKENCVPCCYVCNSLKYNLSLEDWEAKMAKICLKDYDNLFFNYNFEEVSKELLRLQRGNFKKQKRNTKNQINTLTEQEHYYLVTSNCFYCDAKPGNFNKSISKDFYQGIDRKNNDFGYLFENCLPACHSCNFAKSDMSYNDFINHLKKLQEYQKSLIVL